MKPKVLIIVENQSVPPDFRVLKEARSLRDNGYEVTVLCPRRKNWSQGLEMFEGIRIYRHPTPREGHTTAGYLWEYGYALIWELLYTWWIYLRQGFQVIQGCNPPDNLFLVALPFKALGVKYIFDHHDASPELYLSKSEGKTFLYKILLSLEKGTYRFSDAVMVTNESYKSLAMTRGRVAAENVFIVRNGPDPKTFQPVAPTLAVRDGKRYLVGYVGTMNSQDGLDILVEVVQYIKDLGRRDIRFVCVGTGPELPILRKMVKDRNLGDLLHFTGFIPDREMIEVLSTADVCVNPDKPCEMNDISTMIKVLEYMALGKPIVQFESKEGRFSAQEASLYADKTNQVPDFANKILWLLERPDERKRMGEFGRKRIENELAWEHSAEKLLGAYERVLGKRARRMDQARGPQKEKAAVASSEGNATVATTKGNQVNYSSSHSPYVLITPAHNEAAFIEKTIESVIHQTLLPLKWVIVDDGSTDRTAEIVRPYLADYGWIEMVQLPQRRDRSFAGKVHAFNAGLARVSNLPYELIGNLDGDISFGTDHFEFLADQFFKNPDLGVAGTIFKEEGGYTSDKDSFEGHKHVAGQCQVFRRKCWEEIGGYIPHRAGGIDWMAVITARLMGWETESFRERSFFHHRRLGTADRGVVASSFAYGEKDYYLGGHPIWEICRVAYRLSKTPYIIAGVALGAGYFWAWIRRRPRPVSPKLMAFHRQEQLAKLRAILSSLVRLRRVDKFDVHRRTYGTKRAIPGA